jgi:hypothetical protein
MYGTNNVDHHFLCSPRLLVGYMWIIISCVHPGLLEGYMCIITVFTPFIGGIHVTGNDDPHVSHQ